MVEFKVYMKQRGVILLYYEQQGYGGVDTHMAQLINNWPELSDRFIVISNPENEGLKILKSQLRNPKVEISEINGVFNKAAKNNNLKISRIFKIVQTQIKFIVKFSQILKEQKPNILICNNGGYPGGLTCFLAALIGRMTRSINRATFLLIHHAPSPKKNILYYYADFLALMSRWLKIPVITVSRASKVSLEAYTPLKNLHVIYNGLEFSTEKFKGRDLKQEFGIATNRVLVGMIGPIDSHKGHENILEAFSQSCFLRENAHFVIVGSGSDQLVSRLKNKTRDYGLLNIVTFTGYLPGDSQSIIAGFDILAMPTIDFEGFGYSMAEGMAAGVPVVASRVGAIPEVVEDRISGILVDPGDINDWSKQLEEFVRNASWRETIGASGKARIEKEFSANKMSQLYFDHITRH